MGGGRNNAQKETFCCTFMSAHNSADFQYKLNLAGHLITHDVIHIRVLSKMIRGIYNCGVGV